MSVAIPITIVRASSGTPDVFIGCPTFLIRLSKSGFAQKTSRCEQDVICSWPHVAGFSLLLHLLVGDNLDLPRLEVDGRRGGAAAGAPRRARFAPTPSRTSSPHCRSTSTRRRRRAAPPPRSCRPGRASSCARSRRRPAPTRSSRPTMRSCPTSRPRGSARPPAATPSSCAAAFAASRATPSPPPTCAKPRARDRPLAGGAVPVQARPHRPHRPGHDHRPPSRAHQRHLAEPVHALGAGLLDAAIYDSALYRSTPPRVTRGRSVGLDALGELRRLLGGRLRARQRDRAAGQPGLLAQAVLHPRLHPPGAQSLDALRRGARRQRHAHQQPHRGGVPGGAGHRWRQGISARVLQTGPDVIAWHLNVASGPLANPQVREALKLGVDRGSSPATSTGASPIRARRRSPQPSAHRSRATSTRSSRAASCARRGCR